MMDHFGVERAVLVGWSMGVNTAFEIAVDHPERVADCSRSPASRATPSRRCSVRCGCRLRPPARSRSARPRAPAWRPPASRSPPACPWADAPSTSQPQRLHAARGRPRAGPAAVAAFLQTPVEWYFHVAVHTSRHPRVRLSKVRAPAAFVAGTWDVLAGHHAMRSARKMADATYNRAAGTHFLQMEHPRRCTGCWSSCVGSGDMGRPVALRHGHRARGPADRGPGLLQQRRIGSSAGDTVTATPQPSDTWSSAAPPSTPASSASSARTVLVDTTPPRVVRTIATGLAARGASASLPDGDAVVTERDTRRCCSSAPSYDVREVGTISAAVPWATRAARPGCSALRSPRLRAGPPALLLPQHRRRQPDRQGTARRRPPRTDDGHPSMASPTASSTTAAGWCSARTATSTPRPARPGSPTWPRTRARWRARCCG